MKYNFTIAFKGSSFVYSLLIILCSGLSARAIQNAFNTYTKPENTRVAAADNQQFNFATSNLIGAEIVNPTSLQFGPDERLYVSQQDGIIKAFTINRQASNNYSVSATETIDLINRIPNHNDDGSLAPDITTRQVTGILLTGTRENPVLYVSSSDSRIGGPEGDTNLDTNSGIISRLTWSGSSWVKVDLVRGLPRSEENHSNNGMQLDKQTNTLYVAIGGATNAGSPSVNFAYCSEFALAAAIVSVDLNTIDAMPVKGSGDTAYVYDLPTLDDPSRPNNPDGTDPNDPFGGNDGLNQAKIVPGGPVQIYAPGFRNAYDLVITESRRMYTVDNGANQGWGGYPDKEGADGTVTNNYVEGEPGSTGPGVNDPQVNNLDNFHYIGHLDSYVPNSYYGGHPTPIRANPAGAGWYTYSNNKGVWRTSKTGLNPLPADWPPLPLDMANPIEGDYQAPGETNSALLTFVNSTNGIAEYRATNFNGALKGSLLTASFDGAIYLINLTADGTDVTNHRAADNKLNEATPFATGFGAIPLDVIAQADDEIFPGTVWAATYGDHAITIFEPQDFFECSGAYTTIDEDKDGYTNADEIDNNTNPCSGASKPRDLDGDLISDLNDPDDDNDDIGDNLDYFAIDAQNGKATNLPVKYDLFNNNPGTGLFGVGFTGLMTNQKPDNNYSKLYDNGNLIAGGAVGAFTVVNVSSGDALGTQNNQENAFQFGVNVSASTGPFTVRSRMLGSFFNNRAPVNGQSQGLFIGTGDQDNYFSISLNANGGVGGIKVIHENGGEPVSYQYLLAAGIPTSTIDLYLSVDPVAGFVQPKYSADGGPEIALGEPIQLKGDLLQTLQGTDALAVGIVSTTGGASAFTATWDYLYITTDPVQVSGSWNEITAASGTPVARHESSFVQAGDKFYLMGGRGIKPVQAYIPSSKTWTDHAQTPIELHHFQAVTLDGLIYVAGAFTGGYPYETPVPHLYIYDPVKNTWIQGPAIPENRLRGSAGAVVYNKKLYLVGGLTDGHNSGHVTWFDEYDPATNTWKTMPDAPRARDHFHAAIVHNKLYLAGGRRSSYGTGETFSLTVPEVDVFDFATGTWQTLPAASNIPTPRAGTTTAVLGEEVIVIGGESVAQTQAHQEVEALNINNHTWRRLANLQQGRHGMQAIVNNNGIYVAAGSGQQGGEPELNTQEGFYMFAPSQPTGTALSAGSLVAPSALNFGASAGTKIIAIANNGTNQAVVVTGLTISGSSDFRLKEAVAFPFIVAPGASRNIEVNFTPQTTGEQFATLTLQHSGSGGSVTVALSGGETAPTQPSTVLRINAGGSQLTNSIGTFSADNYFVPVPGFTYTNAVAIAGTLDDAMYQTERSSVADNGSFSYSIPVENGQYTVKLHFAELFWWDQGQRVFDVSAEGVKVLDNYDIVQKAGASEKAVVETLTVNVADGKLDLFFTAAIAEGGKNRPKVSAIEVLGTGPAPNQPPVANAGPDKTITLPTNSVQLTGSGTDADGSIAAYSWSQVSGPNTATFSSKTIAQPTISNLVQGSYSFSLLVTDDKGLVSEADQVIVTVNPASTQQTAIVRINSGGGQLTNSIGTFAADNYFSPSPGFTYTNAVAIAGTLDDAIYQTERSTTTDNGSFSYSIPLSNGQYTVKLHFAELFWWDQGQRVFDVSAEGVKVLDNYDIVQKAGTSEKAVVETITVNVTDGKLDLFFTAATTEGGINRPKVSAIEVLSSGPAPNQLPIANAGPDQTVTAASDGFASVQLNGSASYDPDGTIIAYKWTKGSTQLSTNVSFNISLATGTHTFTLTVTDDKGVTASDDVVVTINAATANQPPIANAGPDKTITLPTNSVQLTGSGTDADGSIAAYSWSQVSGPNTATFSSKTIAQPTISNLVQGSYSFSLAVTDDKGLASAADQVIVTVNPAPTKPTAIVRINAGGSQVSNSIGTFAADNYFSPAPGFTYSSDAPIAGTTDDAMYQTERISASDNGSFSYSIPVENGQYTVKLHFAELFWWDQGQRVFDVSAEGVKVLDNYDIVQKAGDSEKAVLETITVNVADGKLDLFFSAAIAEGGKNRPKVSAIEVLGTSSVSSATTIATLSKASTVSGLQVYPNPGKGDMVKVDVEGFEAGEAVMLKLYDMNGRELYTETLTTDLHGNANTDLKPERQLNSGVYLIRAQSEKHKATVKLVIL
ncbi:malectin domain-containing carbohydrate-binding protein [Pontibacter fetidus]|uniref:T9SS type A sorting domain-containing protein n=1 Tax=Pontibacter fetidus TaxID=2700082 RepID=A0A6B2H8P8_9BACT|nr:malectin domain-containing carbohydrate-binding protein [Pontibacter fetidus]NDK55802.1 T9SS type A sorting domain-containing protein [Pontibacter fetidus]